MILARRIEGKEGWTDGIYVLRGLVIPDRQTKVSEAQKKGSLCFDCESGDVLILDPYEAEMIAKAVNTR